jgi:hypothetical protein
MVPKVVINAGMTLDVGPAQSKTQQLVVYEAMQNAWDEYGAAPDSKGRHGFVIIFNTFRFMHGRKYEVKYGPFNRPGNAKLWNSLARPE